MADWAAGHGLSGAVRLAIFHDDPAVTPAAELRSDVCVEVPEGLEWDEPDIRGEILPELEALVVLHRGSYAGLPAAWGALYSEELPASGRRPGGHSPFEVYLNDCSQAPEDEVLTELWLPVL